MSDALKHECGIALVRLLKPLEYYKEYGSFYGIQKMYLLMEKAQPWTRWCCFASIKLDVEPGERYISRVRSNNSQPIQDVFAQINDRINEEMALHPSMQTMYRHKKANIPTLRVILGHVRYGTLEK
jgi:amidophosphoribosyltransferase